MSEKSDMSRRELLQAAAGLGAAGAVLGTGVAAAAAGATAQVRFNNTFDFRSPEWNRDAYARLQGDLDFSKTRYGWLGGPVMGVVPGEKIKPLFYMEGFSACRLIAAEGGYRKQLREIVVYREIHPFTGKPGAILSEWDNPYTGERVKVVPIMNDPFNYNITLNYPEPPSFGGLNKEKPPPAPFILPWSVKGNTLLLTTDIHLYYPNALQPDKWPRESSGPMVQVSELYRYQVRVEDMKNPNLTQVPCTGCWSRITPWLPWMLMGTRTGHAFYMVDFTGSDTIDASPELLAYLKSSPETAKFLTPPESDYGPSLSSLENYAKTQKPAPVK
ncbi:MAG: DUF1838 family protein [Steroidobacteraceae bacterium]